MNGCQQMLLYLNSYLDQVVSLETHNRYLEFHLTVKGKLEDK